MLLQPGKSVLAVYCATESCLEAVVKVVYARLRKVFCARLVLSGLMREHVQNNGPT